MTRFPAEARVRPSTATTGPALELGVPAVPVELAVCVGRVREGAVLDVEVCALERGDGRAGEEGEEGGSAGCCSGCIIC